MHLHQNHFQNELEKEKDEKIRHLENQYENSLRSIGQGHREASEQVGQGYIEAVKNHTYFILIHIKLEYYMTVRKKLESGSNTFLTKLLYQ